MTANEIILAAANFTVDYYTVSRETSFDYSPLLSGQLVLEDTRQGLSCLTCIGLCIIRVSLRLVYSCCENMNLNDFEILLSIRSLYIEYSFMCISVFIFMLALSDPNQKLMRICSLGYSIDEKTCYHLFDKIE